MLPFSFSTAGRIIFGAGTVKQAAIEATRMGHHALLVTGSTSKRAAILEHRISEGGRSCTRFQIDREPDVEIISEGAQLARDRQCDMVIGFGGGSVMDGAKAIAALITNLRPLLDYLEVIGHAMPLEQAPAPCIVVPTTAGTGSEVTRNAVIRSPRHRIKVSMRSQGMLPDLAVIDPELTLTLPPDITAATGFDALTQLIEALVSAKANPLTDGLSREGLTRCARSLKTVYHQKDNLAARTDMCVASLFSGLALANAGLGAVHGIAGPLGGMIDAPHGAVCARLLPVVTAANVTALRQNAPQSPYIGRFREVARVLTGRPDANTDEGVQWLKAAARELGIPPLTQWGLKEEDVPELIDHALRASSMGGNPVELDRTTLTTVIHRAMELGET